MLGSDVYKLRLILSKSEFDALNKAAEQELRYPPDQIRYILRQELEKQGFIKSVGDQSPAAQQ